jgi:hypothetical protein
MQERTTLILMPSTPNNAPGPRQNRPDNEFARLFPQIPAAELAAAEARFVRYLEIALEIHERLSRQADSIAPRLPPLTDDGHHGSMINDDPG